jgi:hypothetical protein
MVYANERQTKSFLGFRDFPLYYILEDKRIGWAFLLNLLCLGAFFLC